MSLSALTLLCTLAVAPGDGDAFTRMPLEQAVDEARREGRLLVIHFLVGWSGPCRVMNKRIFADEGVMAWFEGRGLAIKVDVEKRADLKSTYHVVTVPTVVALRDGLEVGRYVGDLKPEPFLEWLERMAAVADGVEQGGMVLPLPRSAPDVLGVLRDVQLASDNGRLREALAGCLWLWDRAARQDPAMTRATRGLVLEEIRQLVRQDGEAARVFAEVAQELGQRLGPDVGLASWIDWIVLSSTLGRQEALVEWVRERRDDSGRLGPGAEGGAAAVPTEAVELLFGVLAEQGHYAEAARLLGDLVGLASDRAARNVLERGQLAATELAEDVRAGILESHDQRLRHQLADIYCVALTLEDGEQARLVGERLLATLDDVPSRVALVGAALRAGRFGEVQRTWLEQAAAGATTDDERHAVERLQAELSALESVDG